MEKEQEEWQSISVGEYYLSQSITYKNGSREVIGHRQIRDICHGNLIATFDNDIDMIKFVVMKIKEQEDK